MGIYSVCPGSDEYTLTSPLFPEIKINMENGKTFLIRNDIVSSTDYANAFNINGEEKNIPFISQKDIRGGGELVFKKIPNPNNSNAIKSTDYSGSIDIKYIVTSPIINAASKSFANTLPVAIESSQKDVSIYYTLDGSIPALWSSKYDAAINISSSGFIKAIAVNKEGKQSKVATAHFYKKPHPDWKITIHSKYNTQYTAGGDEGIIDGIRGDANWRKGDWQGYQGQDFEAIIDMGKEQSVSRFTAGFLQDVRSWILMPKRVEFEISLDGKNFTKALSLDNMVADKDEKVQIKDFSGSITKQNTRYIKVKAINYGRLPEWHPGYADNGEAFIFIDEIGIN
jgi:hypothetical protein